MACAARVIASAKIHLGSRELTVGSDWSDTPGGAVAYVVRLPVDRRLGAGGWCVVASAGGSVVVFTRTTWGEGTQRPVSGQWPWCAGGLMNRTAEAPVSSSIPVSGRRRGGFVMITHDMGQRSTLSGQWGFFVGGSHAPAVGEEEVRRALVAQCTVLKQMWINVCCSPEGAPCEHELAP